VVSIRGKGISTLMVCEAFLKLLGGDVFFAGREVVILVGKSRPKNQKNHKNTKKPKDEENDALTYKKGQVEHFRSL